MYEQRCKATDALSGPEKTLALQQARDKWDEFWAQRPGCSDNPQCSFGTPCGNLGCEYAWSDSPATGLCLPQAAARGASILDPPSSDSTAASARTIAALPDPEPALPDPAQTPNVTATDPPLTVDTPGIATILALQGATTTPQAAAQASTGRLTVWQAITGFMRMFAKSENKTLMITALLFLLMLQFGGVSLL
jgi:hypothetical protein